MTDAWLLHSDTWNLLTVCKQITNNNTIIRERYKYLKPFNWVQKKEEKKSSGLFKNVINKMY